MKRVKKVGLVVIMFMAVVCMTGCGLVSKEQQRKDLLKEYATTYFNNHMIGIQNTDEDVQINVIEINLSMLKQVNDLNLEEKYDLAKFAACKDESRVELTINPETQEIDNYEFYLSCE